MMDDRAFNANDLKLRPEQLKNLRPVETSAAKPKRSKREFIQITREQSDRLDKAKSFATEIVFRHLLFLNWKSPGRTIHLSNVALAPKGVYRQAKRRALLELKKLGLIKLKICPRKSPQIVVKTL
jgi:hypothetical protein